MKRAQCCSWTLLITAVGLSIGQDPVKWGPITENLQLGIGATAESSASGQALRVSLKNLSSGVRELPMGYTGTAGPVYNVKIAAVRDQQTPEQLVFDLNALQAHPTGLVVPKILRLEPGKTEVLTFPVKQLICVLNGRDVPLDNLLKQGYSIFASIEISGVELLTPRLTPIEMGTKR
jgi:hypothetical protein